MTVKTKVLDRAAFLCCFGGKIIELEGRTPDNIFTLEIPDWLMGYEKVGAVNWRKFANMRKQIKRKTRRAAGLPIRYGMKSKGNQLKDIATFKSWDKNH